jgi:hypothetical protein
MKKLRGRIPDVELPYVSMSSGPHGLPYDLLAAELST